MSKLKGIDSIMLITAQLLLEGIHCESNLGNEVRIKQASILIQACSQISGKSVLELMLTCKTLAVTMNDDFTKHERINEGADILNNLFSDDKNNKKND